MFLAGEGCGSWRRDSGFWPSFSQIVIGGTLNFLALYIYIFIYLFIIYIYKLYLRKFELFGARLLKKRVFGVAG